jgi:Heterokaryon incompatibility protein (HET)
MAFWLTHVVAKRLGITGSKTFGRLPARQNGSNHPSQAFVRNSVHKKPKIANVGALSLVACLAIGTGWVEIHSQANAQPENDHVGQNVQLLRLNDNEVDQGLSTNPRLYQHEPLPLEYDTRMLVICPGAYGEQIEVKVVPVESLAKAEYDALSYEWGEKKLTHFLSCGGRQIRVRANLHAALQRIRSRDKEQMIWVDAVCIDQENEDEKPHQFRKMTEIYSHAQQVIVWLGEECYHDHLVSSSLERLRTWQFNGIRGWIRLNDGSCWAGSGMVDLLDFDHEPLIRLLHDRGWFRRTWIIQEAALGRKITVHYGERSFPWRDLKRIYSKNLSLTLASKGGEADTVRRSLDSISLIESVRKKRHSMSVFDCVLATCSNECSEDQDKIYAVLSLGNDAAQHAILKKPKSARSYSNYVERVYKEFAIQDCKGNKSLRILFHGLGNRSTSSSLPSWVPDWRWVGNQHPFARYSHKTNFTAAGQTALQVSFSDDKNILHVTGKNVDLIKTDGGGIPNFTGLVTPSELGGELIRGLQRTAQWLKEVKSIANSNQNSHIDDKKVYQTLICELTPDGRPAPQAYYDTFPEYFKLREAAAEQYHEYEFDCKSHPAGVDIMKHFNKNSRQHALIDASIQKWSSRRRFCVTENGHFACVPKDAKPGDQICILFGANIPYVLRPTGHGYHQVVGECYVNGIMHGAGLEDELEPTRFRLK